MQTRWSATALKRCGSVQANPPPIDSNEAFLKGLQSYLQKHSYNNTSSNDLWAELDAATGEDVSKWMRAWTFQPGFPRVQILLDGPLKNDVMVYQVCSFPLHAEVQISFTAGQ